jgi:hypothetical protein
MMLKGKLLVPGCVAGSNSYWFKDFPLFISRAVS